MFAIQHTRGTTQIAEGPPLLKSNNLYALTQQSRGESTARTGLLSPGSEVTNTDRIRWLAPTAISLTLSGFCILFVNAFIK